MNRLWIILLVALLPICMGSSGKPGYKRGVESEITFYQIAENNIVDTDAGFSGCLITNTFTLTQVAAEVCKVPPGTRRRVVATGVYIATLDSPISECDLSISADGVDIAATTISIGGTDLDEVGEFVVNLLPDAPWHGEGVELVVSIADNSANCEDGAADINRVAYWYKTQTEFVD